MKIGEETFYVLLISLAFAFVGCIFWFETPMETIPLNETTNQTLTFVEVVGIDGYISACPIWLWIVLFFVLLEIIFVIVLLCNKKEKSTSWFEHIFVGKVIAIFSVCASILGSWVICSIVVWLLNSWKNLLLVLGSVVAVIVGLYLFYLLNLDIAKLIGNEEKPNNKK